MLILVDIDHTLSDARWRDHMLEPAVKDWVAYHTQSIDDPPVAPMIQLVKRLQKGKEEGDVIAGLTARPEQWRPLTMKWLFRHGVELDELYMRPDYDFRPSPECKLALVEQYLSDVDKMSVIFLEDNEKICRAFLAAGFCTLRVGMV